MMLYAQHGWGKSDKISRGLDTGDLSGVILSPKDELPTTLEATIRALAYDYPDTQLLIDPQFYQSTIMPSKEGYLPKYADCYYYSNLSRGDFSPAQTETYVKKVIDYQMTLPVTRIVSPSILLEDFNDGWSQITLSLAQASLKYHSELDNPPPLLISVIFSENALSSRDAVNEFLNIITRFDNKGFYLIVKRNNSSYQQQMDITRLENLMYFVYSLSEINEFEVIVGYSDIIGILLQAVGAAATACGWHGTLRQMSAQRLEPSKGGNQPRVRYTSMPLFNSILVIPELAETFRFGNISDVITGTSYDSPLLNNPTDPSWGHEVSWMHHWEALNTRIKDLKSQGSIKDRLDFLERKIALAKVVYNKLKSNGLVFDTYTGSEHLDQWLSAIQHFRSLTGE